MASTTKTKTVTLSYPHSDPNVVGGYHYRVERVSNSTEVAPGQFLSKQHVDELCAAKDWNVTVVPPKEQK